jgi:hypothetical protein
VRNQQYPLHAVLPDITVERRNSLPQVIPDVLELLLNLIELPKYPPNFRPRET